MGLLTPEHRWLPAHRQAACPREHSVCHTSVPASFSPCGLLCLRCHLTRQTDFTGSAGLSLNPEGNGLFFVVPRAALRPTLALSPHPTLKIRAFLALTDVPDSLPFTCAFHCFQSIHIVCNATSLQFQNILSPQKKPCSRQQSPHPLPQPLTTRNLLSVSVDLPALHVSHGWSHTLCVLLCLRLSLNIMSSGLVHVVASVRASLLFMAEGRSRVWISSPTTGHLGVSTFWLLGLILLDTLMYKYLCGHVSSTCVITWMDT